METGVAPQKTVMSKKGRRGIGLALVHTPLADFSSPVSQEIMQTVTRFHSLAQSDCRILVVTGWDVADRAAELSLQMARGLTALTQQSVLLVDADFRAPQLHQKLRTPVAPGLAELIADLNSLQDVVRPTPDELFYFLPAGDARELSDAGLLSAPACANTLSILRQFQTVVIHAGPLLENASAMVITAESDAVVLALAAGIRTREEAETLQRQVTSLRGNLVGAVLTESESKKRMKIQEWPR